MPKEHIYHSFDSSATVDLTTLACLAGHELENKFLSPVYLPKFAETLMQASVQMNNGIAQDLKRALKRAALNYFEIPKEVSIPEGDIQIGVMEIAKEIFAYDSAGPERLGEISSLCSLIARECETEFYNDAKYALPREPKTEDYLPSFRKKHSKAKNL